MSILLRGGKGFAQILVLFRGVTGRLPPEVQAALNIVGLVEDIISESLLGYGM